MNYFRFHPLGPLLALGLAGTAHAAEQLAPNDGYVNDNLCVGTACSPTLPLSAGFDEIVMYHTNMRLKFVDSSSSSGSFASVDWALQANEPGAVGRNQFMLVNLDDNTVPFVVSAGAPTNALFLDNTGQLGLGTSLPTDNLQIEDPSAPSIRLFRNGSAGGSQADWSLAVGTGGFFVSDRLTTSDPFSIAPGASTNALVITNTGDVGVGLPTTRAPLHVWRGDGTASLLVENASTSPSAVREMFKMSNNGGSYFTLDNTQSNTQWFFVHENTAPNRFIITDGVADGPEMTLTADGILTVEGGFVARGTTLNVPDYVFAEDYALRPLAEVASFIEENSHLPEVPSAGEIAETGLDMTQMQMTLLKKVEELTLYTIALEENARMQSELIAKLSARLDQME